jgi:hypothetical protein
MKKIGIILAEILAGAIGLVGVVFFLLGLLLCYIALGIATALEDANDSYEN